MCQKYSHFIFLNFVFFAIELSQVVTGGSTLFRMYDIFHKNEYYSLWFAFHPLIAFIIQMIVGSLSDYCTYKKGRRRIFLSIGCIISCVSLLVSVCMLIWGYTVEIDDQSDDNYEINITICNIIFALASYGNVIGYSFMKVAYRAFILDEFDSDYQYKVYTMSSLAISISRIVVSSAGFICAIVIYSLQSNDDRDNCTQQITIYFCIMQLFCIVCLIVTTIHFDKIALETPIETIDFKDDDETTEDRHSSNQSGNKARKICKSIWSTLKTDNTQLLSIFIVMLFGYLAKYSIDYSGTNIIVVGAGLNRDEDVLNKMLYISITFFISSLVMMISCFLMFLFKNHMTTPFFFTFFFTFIF